MRKELKLLLPLAVMILFIAGCADLRQKFIPRKKEDESRTMHYYAVRKYDVKPSLELYTKRYVYWKNWQKEILDVIDNRNHKKIVVALEQAVSNLIDMRNMLVEEKARELQTYIDEMTEIEMSVKEQRMTRGTKVRTRRKLESLGKQIKRHFSYNRVGGYIADDFRYKQQD
ncbi:MAG: hypothetical protein GF392_05700 [Candidatus Omnitrophica bacterium]|nr:hypothetical protein [Candidatus Omnitrophota bacterium]